MKKDDKKSVKGLSDSPDYEVGYGKPPKETRFKKGQSGNSKGRPKGSTNRKLPANEERLKSIILEEAYRSITVRDGDRNVSVPMAQAVVRSLAVNAVKGQTRAQQLFTELLTTTERANRRQHDELLETAIKYKADWEQELERRDRLGITGLADPLPHPDQIEIDFQSGKIRITGPRSKEEKMRYDLWIDRREMMEEELKCLTDELKNIDSQMSEQTIRDDIRDTEKILEIINRGIEEFVREW